MSRQIDVAQTIDAGVWHPWQIGVVILGAMSIVLDGFDNQIIGLAIPSIMTDWSVSRSAFSNIFAIGLFGMLVGATLSGWIGDRYGRRPALLASTFLFAFATVGVVFALGVSALLILRFLSGLGLGGAIPMAGTISAEFAPARGRAVAVTLTIVCVPGGGALAGTIASFLLPAYGWRVLFALGGAGAMLIGLLLALLLPESPRFLARQPGGKAQLLRVMNRLGFETDANDEFAVPGTTQTSRSFFSVLLGKMLLRDTLSLWLAFFFCTMSVYTAFNWLPSLLAAGGVSKAGASAGLAAYNAGGVIGPILFSALIAWAGSRTSMIAGAVFAAVMAFALGAMHPGYGTPLSQFNFALGLFGFFVNASQTLLYALAAHIYPTGVRATGVATAACIGRLGAIVSSYTGAIVSAGYRPYFEFQAATMAICLVGIMLVGSHIPRMLGATRGAMCD